MKRNATFTLDMSTILDEFDEEDRKLEEVEQNNIESTKSKTKEVRDWNSHFQSILHELKQNREILERRVRCYQELSNLALDFVHCAKTYGRIIISEAGLIFLLKPSFQNYFF